MEYSYALEKLSNHANSPAPSSNLPENESFLLELWQAERQSRIPDLRNLFDDILSCFEAVNHELNTQHPSENIAGKAATLPRSLVGNVSAILSVGWNYYWQWTASQQFNESFRKELAATLMQLGFAWDAILAGDIDDIREHCQSEFMARGLAT